MIMKNLEQVVDVELVKAEEAVKNAYSDYNVEVMFNADDQTLEMAWQVVEHLDKELSKLKRLRGI
jgi:hypothetical protein